MFFVVLLHVSARNWHHTDVNGLYWHVFNIYDSISRWTVPVFVMISGALFLNKNICIKQLYQKYIFKIVVVFFVWSTFYCFLSGRDMSLKNIINGEYHMWFLLMLIGLYVLLPILQKIIKNKNVMKYFLLLVFIFSSFIPFINKIMHDFFGCTQVITLVSKKTGLMNMPLALEYAGYFVLGYYLNLIHLSKKQRMLIYIGGLLGAFLTIFLNALMALKTQQPYGDYYENFTVNVLLCSVAVFVWFKYLNFSEKVPSVIFLLSKCSLGIYMVHIFVLNALNAEFGLNSLSFNPVFCTPLLAILICILSAIIVGMLYHIPILKKYII